MTVLTITVLAAVLVLTGAVLFLVVRQQGRLLLRIDAIERAIGLQGDGGGVLGIIAHNSVAVDPNAAMPVGLPIGSALETFTLPDLDGHPVSLEDFRGRQVVLVNWGPTCGFCDAIAPDLVAAVPALEEAGAMVVLLAHGDATSNRAMADRHGLTSPILLLGDANPAGFQAMGTPVGFAIDAEGQVASTLSIGADKVPKLVQRVIDGTAGEDPTGDDHAGHDHEGHAHDEQGHGGATYDGDVKLRGQRDLSTSQIVRDGLKAGTPAPPFALPEVRGGIVSLDDFRGRRVLLAFSDPDCVPCDALAPYLAKVHQEDEDGLAVILVGRGDVESNRRKAEEQGLAFPVVLQDGWKLSREYGIFATPVAFLIDEHGTITRNVAQGVDEIVALVP